MSDLIQLLNVFALIATMAFGMISWFAPRRRLVKQDQAGDGPGRDDTENLAANGALFVGLSLAALGLGTPMCYAMVGFAYAGAAIGRASSILSDGSANHMSVSFLALETAFALFLIMANV